MMPMTVMQQLGQASADLDRRGRLGGFLQVARCMIVGRGDPFEVRDHASQSRLTPQVLQGIEALTTRASVAAATTTDSTWAAPLAGQGLADAFAESLRDASALDRLLVDMVRIPPATKVSVVSAGISGATVGEGQVKPAGRLSAQQFDTVMKKSVAFIVVSRELMRASSPGALALLRRELVGAVAAVTDQTFIDDLTSGISTIPSSGGTSLGIRADLRAALDAVDTGSASKLYWITNSSIAKRLAVIGDSAGSAAFPEVERGLLGPWPLVTSDAVGSGLLVLCDASQVAASALPVELDVSDTASIQLDTSPDSPPSATSAFVNLWQLNASALRCTRYFASKRLRDTAVAVVSSFAATGNSPS